MNSDVRSRLCEEYLGNAYAIARDYGRDDDLKGVAHLALVEAVDAVDPFFTPQQQHTFITRRIRWAVQDAVRNRAAEPCEYVDPEKLRSLSARRDAFDVSIDVVIDRLPCPHDRDVARAYVGGTLPPTREAKRAAGRVIRRLAAVVEDL